MLFLVLHDGLSPSPPPGPESGSRDPIRCGGLCPHCGEGTLDYNGLLDLECSACGYILSGGAGCT